MTNLPLLLLVALIIAGLFTFLYFVPINLWIMAFFSGVRVSLIELAFMRIRKVPPSLIVKYMIIATKAGLKIVDDEGSPPRSVRTQDLETHFLAGGNVQNVIKALISADKANIKLTFKQGTAIDLAGREILKAVGISIKPKVINTPKVTAVAQDGIQLLVTARVTVRTNLQQLVGGAVEETILARVGEGIVTSIGSAGTHTNVLENPDNISRLVLERGLDAGTAFEILSIDIADVDVGENIGAKLMIDQANADLKVAKANAEKRRAMAVAVEQEMVARSQEMKAKVIEAEAEIPKSIAEAFRSGNLGIMDYYRLRNIQADTDMRGSIAGGPADSGGTEGKIGDLPDRSDK